MTFQTIMTHIGGNEANPALLDTCSMLTRAWDAHLDVVCHGVDRMTAGFHYGGVDPAMVQQSFQQAYSEAEALAADARSKLKNADVRWAVEQSVSSIGTLGRSVAQRARFSDLVVLPSPYGEMQPEEGEAILEGALFDGQAPVMVLPKNAPVTDHPDSIIIGWNEGREALNAVRAAMPLLTKASHVRVTVIDPPRHSNDRSDPGGPLSVFLARHGVNVEIDVLGKSLPRVSDVIMRHAGDTKADLIVMGAYGHSRFREALLGGATRDMLEQTELPVLMAH